MADIPPVSGVADLEARLDRRGFAKEDKLFFTLSDCEGALRSVEAGRDHDVKPRLADCLGAAGCLTVGPRGSTLTSAGHAILAEIDARRGRR